MKISWFENLFCMRPRRASNRRRGYRSSSESLEQRQVLTMLAPVSVSSGAAVAMVEVRDMNGDSINDIVELNSTAQQVSVLLGNSDGSFQAGINSAAGGGGTKMASADFNHDGNVDLVTVEGYQIDLLKGNGDGSFQAPVAYYASAYPNDIDVGDINNDGLEDVFTASFSYGGTTQLFINDGLGGFLPSHNLAIGPTGLQIEGADVNGDGNLDLVQSNGGGWYAVLVGHGDGTFVSAATQNIGMTSQDLKVADFNGDGMADMVVTNGTTVSVYAGAASSVFQSPTTYPLAGASRLELGDINGDGKRDVVGNNGMVLLGRGNGGFYAPTAYGTATGTTIGLGDINGDGSLDAVSGTSLGLSATINGNNDIQLLAGATQISVSAAASAQAGVPFAVTVTALDADGNVVTGFQGTVGIMGAAGTIPVSYTFSASDNGVHTIADAAKLFAVGAGTYTVTSPFLPDASGTIDVWAGPAAKFTVTANQTTAVAGTSTGVTVSSFDAYGNAASNYHGTVHLASSDVLAGLPSDYTFTVDDAGSHTFEVALKKVGYQNVSVSDTVTGTVRGTSGLVSVTPAAAASLTVTATTGYVGSVNAVYVHALDAYGNMATSYNGVVHLTSSDAGTTVSNDAALFNGSGTLTFTPTVMGPQTLTATDVVDGSIAGSGVVNVTPGWGARFVATALPSTTAAGQTQYTTLTVYDSFGNVSTVYTGVVAVTSPGDSRVYSYVYFSAADAGVKTIPVTLYKAGVQAVTISDVSNPGITTTQTGITVTAGTVSSISATPLQATTAGATQNVTVTGRDIYGNVATGYLGTVTFASTDTLATLPADYTFTAADAGSHTFPVTFRQSGTQDFTIADTTTPVVVVQYYQPVTMTYSQLHIPVSPDVLSTFAIKGASTSNTTAGSTINLIVTPSDAYGNAIDNYAGTVRITTTDAQASAPSSYTYNFADQGTHTFSVTLKTAGSQSITFTDSANSAVTGSVASTVKAAAASKLSLSTASSTNVGVAQNVTASVTDAYGNPVTNYTGTVTVTSSDAQAVLPANYTFTNKDGGTHTFSVTLKTVGTQSITVTDTTNAAITATQSGITVNQVIAQVASFSVSGFPATTAGTAKSFSVTARDASGNVISGYTGTINFSSSDVKAGLPASYTFTAADAGSHTFSATLKTAGSQSITVKDAAIGTAIGTQSGITVTAGVATQFVLSAPSSAVASSSINVTLTVYDAYGNIATGYTGKVTLSSTDGKAGSTSYSFSSRDAGVHVFSYKFGTVGLQTMTLTDSVNSLSVKTTINVTAK